MFNLHWFVIDLYPCGVIRCSTFSFATNTFTMCLYLLCFSSACLLGPGRAFVHGKKRMNATLVSCRKEVRGRGFGNGTYRTR